MVCTENDFFFLLLAADAFSSTLPLIEELHFSAAVAAHYTLHESLLTSKRKRRKQPALLLSNYFLARPLSF